MWGKLTERNYSTPIKIITEPHELFRFLATPDVEVPNLAFASDDLVWIPWNLSAQELVPNLRHTNEAIGAYVTVGARLHLCGYLNRLL